MRTKIYWDLQSWSIPRLVIDKPGEKNKIYKGITDSSLQRLIKISTYSGAEIEDNQIIVYGAIDIENGEA